MEIYEPFGRLMRWRPCLGELEFCVQYKKGLLKIQADELYRLPTFGETLVPYEEDIKCFLTTKEDDTSVLTNNINLRRGIFEPLED